MRFVVGRTVVRFACTLIFAACSAHEDAGVDAGGARCATQAVARAPHVMMTTDLETWSCIGQAPADAASIGSLDGVVYFGGIEGRVYNFEQPSW